MKTLKFNWFATLFVMALSMSFVSCGGDDDDDIDTGTEQGGGNNASGKYIATTDVKTVALNASYFDEALNSNIIMHEDFYYKYVLHLAQGHIITYPFDREEGEWTEAYWINYMWYLNIGFKDIGKVNGITEIKEKVGIMSSGTTWGEFPTAQPQHGYAFAMKTEDGVKNLRVFIQSYKLASDGSLSQITVQYQLY